ncbi:A24 family peptidase [Vibrio maerlii]|uniref:A24 family peptidase n=1 Tax=Vibrio maerlii TaxID=2231648 RepID=UPI000E3E62C0|nr:A24 family peptidase [Vibrio maerlii]
MVIVLIGYFSLLFSVVCMDIKFRQIPNYLIYLIGILGLFACDCFYFENSAIDIISIFGVGFLLWYLNVWGAGDAKLLTVVSIAIDQQYLPGILLLITMIGGVTALLIIIINRLFGKQITTVPYGVTISIGGMVGTLASL